MNINDYNFDCDYFGSARPNQKQSPIVEKAYKLAEELQILDHAQEYFKQGYVHAHQGRTDIYKSTECRFYKLGFEAA